MKQTARLLVTCVLVLALGGCEGERIRVECHIHDTCKAEGQSFRLNYQQGAQHDFVLRLEGRVPEIEKADIVGVNMDMGVFPLFVQPGSGDGVLIKGIMPVCTLGDAMQWKVRLYTKTNRIEVVLQ